MVKFWTMAVGLLIFCVDPIKAQTLPENEVQINFSNYFDSFDVSIVYPSVSVTKNISEGTSLTGCYLVDMVSAASIKGPGSSTIGASAIGSSAIEPPMNEPRRIRVVDAVTSASGRSSSRSSGVGSGGVFRASDQGEPEFHFDDVRHETGLGLTQLVGLGTVSVNGIYSKENDYSSATLASSLSQSFAKKNTTLSLGFVRSWDRVFPVTKDWKREKNVTTLSGSLSQILSIRSVVQILGSYTTDRGYLADAYQQIAINDESFDPAHPDQRSQKALAGRFKFRLTEKSSMQLGYRYYWDDWQVTSHTGSAKYQRYLSPNIILGLGVRSYVQNKAFFFKPTYSQAEEFMTTDIKLDGGFSNELQFDLSINGDEYSLLGFLGDNIQYNLNASVYQRHSDTPYWFNGSKDLISTDFNFGIRYRF